MEDFLKKNWEDSHKKIKGWLERWNWLHPKMSFRCRIRIANNLLFSSLWHKIMCVDPPAPLLSQIQKVLVDFNWDRLHWIPQSVLFCTKDEGGGQGLVHLASRSTAFCLQFLQRLLTGPKDILWRLLSHCILWCFKGLGQDFNLIRF